MGTVGLVFGSATSGAGFDVSSTVSQILAIQRGVETPWKAQIASLQAQDTVLSSLGADLSALSTKLQTLTDFSGVLAEKEGSSSNTDALVLSSATELASAGSHDITINSLARTSSAYGDTVGTSDTLSGGITIQVGSGAARTINVSSSDSTLAGLQRAINSAGIGVTASILTDSTGSRLALVSKTSGSAGQLTISSSVHNDTAGSSVSFAAGQTGSDASLTVDGVAITSASNTVSNAITGVTFQLLNTSSASVQVEITNNASAVSSAISDFVTAYNTAISDLKAQEGKDSSGNAKPLFGDPTVALLQNQLASALLGGAPSGSISSFTQLGVGLNQDGTLSFSQSTFNAAYNSSPDDVTGFFQNQGSFGNNFQSVLNGLGSSSVSGALYLASAQNASQEKTLNDSISALEARLDAQKASLTKELNLANQILQAIPSQLSEIDQIYSAVTGYNTK